MELTEVIKRRKSIREFIDKEVPNELIEDLIKNAILAPSAKNRQPWKFIIVKDDIKDLIADMMIKNEKEMQSKRKGSSVIYTAMVIKEAPVLILVLKEYNDYWLISDTLSIGAAIEHICLRATDLNLGSLWVADTVYIQEDIAKLVGYENMRVISSICIGYTEEKPKRRARKKLNEVMEWYN